MLLSRIIYCCIISYPYNCLYCCLADEITVPATLIPLQGRHNGRDGASNQQPHDYLLSLLFRSWSKKTSKLCVTGLCAANSPVTGKFPAQMASNAENASIWWRHHAVTQSTRNLVPSIPGRHQFFLNTFVMLMNFKKDTPEIPKPYWGFVTDQNQVWQIGIWKKLGP